MNKHATMRLAKTDPLQLTPLERLYDDIQKFANWERYCVQSANTRDGARADIAPRPRLSRAERGERNSRAKITHETATQIYQDSRSYRAVAAAYGVCQYTVWKIKTGQHWTSYEREQTAPDMVTSFIDRRGF